MADDSENAPVSLYQMTLHPATWPTVKRLIEKQWPNFRVIELPESLQDPEDMEAGIRTYFMALKDDARLAPPPNQPT